MRTINVRRMRLHKGNIYYAWSSNPNLTRTRTHTHSTTQQESVHRLLYHQDSVVLFQCVCVCVHTNFRINKYTNSTHEILVLWDIMNHFSYTSCPKIEISLVIETNAHSLAFTEDPRSIMSCFTEVFIRHSTMSETVKYLKEQS